MAKKVFDSKDFSKFVTKNAYVLGGIAVVAIIIILVIILGMGTNDTELSTQIAESAGAGIKERSTLEIIEIGCTYQGTSLERGHIVKYVGNIRNNGDVTEKNVEVNISFYKGNYLMGSHVDIVKGNDVPAGSVRIFSGEIGFSEKFDTCDAKIVG